VNELAVSATGEASADIKMVGGSALALGQAAMAASVPVVVASDQSNLPANVAQIGGAAAPIGAGLEATAVRVTLPTDGTGVVGLNAGSNLIGSAKIVDTAGSNEAGVDALHNVYVTDGGTTATAVAAGTVADTVIKGSAGRLCRIVVTTAGTNAMEIYDNASAGSGKVIATVAANAVAGTWIDAQMPAANGITTKGDSNNPAVTISFS
jgi:hypothetical protein